MIPSAESGCRGGLASAASRQARIEAARLLGQPSPYHRGPKLRCKRGHRMDERNTQVRADGRRECRECHRRRWRRWDRKRRGLTLPKF